MGTIQFNGSDNKWKWNDVYNSRAAFIGDNRDSNKLKCLSSISKKRLEQDNQSVYWITPYKEGIQGDTVESFDLAAFESLPNFNEAENEGFAKQRMAFLQLYLNLLADKKGDNRTDLIPLGSYLPSQEGAFVGYVKATEKMDDKEKKAYLLEEFSKLTNVLWVYAEGKGYQYIYKETESEAETLLNFFVGCWAFWAFTSILQEQRDLLLIIEVPSSLTQIETDSKIKKQIIEVLSYMSNLTYEITCTTILSTETFFPIPDLNIRHHFYWKYNSKDFNWTLNENEAYFDSTVIESWKAGDLDKAQWSDLSVQNKSVISFDIDDDLSFQSSTLMEELEN